MFPSQSHILQGNQGKKTNNILMLKNDEKDKTERKKEVSELQNLV